MCALMTNDIGNTDKLTVLLNETRSMGLEVLPPDVNEGQVNFAPARDGKVIRFGLAAIKGVGEVAVQSIISARARGGDFTDFDDFCERAGAETANRKMLEALVKTGACDCFGETRKSMFDRIDTVLSGAANTVDIRKGKQRGLDSILEETSPKTRRTSASQEEWPQHELLAAEKELLGFFVTGHPLMPYAPLLQDYALANCVTAAQLPHRSLTRIGGLVSAVQHGVSRKSNKPYAMVTLEDLEGSISMLCMNENYDRYRDLLVPNKAVLVVGEVNNGEDKPKIFPQEIMPLEDAPRKFTKQVHLRLHTAHLNAELLESIRQLALAHPGRCPLFLCLMRPTGEIIFIETHEKFFVTPSSQLRQGADKLLGEETYYAKVDTSLPERAKRVWERASGE
jgi:DNA polymerase-3 subunit alpha